VKSVCHFENLISSYCTVKLRFPFCCSYAVLHLRLQISVYLNYSCSTTPASSEHPEYFDSPSTRLAIARNDQQQVPNSVKSPTWFRPKALNYFEDDGYTSRHFGRARMGYRVWKSSEDSSKTTERGHTPNSSRKASIAIHPRGL
jgi:hypothetical protein